MYFRSRPLFAAFLLCSFISIFKSYPTVADAALVFPLLMMHSEYFKYAPHLYLAVSGILYSIVLGPLQFNSWVYAGSGNANFFYAITLLWSISQVILMTDVTFGFLKREWERNNPGWRKMRPELIYEY
jgi:phosphatidylinositol glycan class U